MLASKIAAALALSLVLAGCSLFGGGDKDKAAENDLSVTGAAGGVIAAHMLDTGSTTFPRPSAALGIYVSAYLAQGIFLPVQSASDGIDVMKKLVRSPGDPATDETFTLLQELGNILQVDVSDVLNRSPDRRVALDQYLQALKNVFVLGERKKTELDTAAESLREEERTKREVAGDLERAINRALDDEDYTGAGSRQRELTEAQGKLAEVQTKREQTEDIAGRFEKLLEVAKERLVAIEANRLILIAGLQVIKLPGIEDLDILLENGRRRQREENTSVFGEI